VDNDSITFVEFLVLLILFGSPSLFVTIAIQTVLTKKVGKSIWTSRWLLMLLTVICHFVSTGAFWLLAGEFQTDILPYWLPFLAVIAFGCTGGVILPRLFLTSLRRVIVQKQVGRA
jgi:hypothetical protein